jgi:BASS family bile acid:Na+ symporter
MTTSQIFKLLMLVSIILNVLALALRARPADTLYLFRERRLGVRAFVAMFVVVPAVAMLIVGAFDLKPPVEIALVALSFSPVPPLLPKKQLKAGGSASYITGLLVAASLVSLVVTPLGLDLAGRIFGVEIRISTLRVARTLAITIAMPLALGLIVGRMLGQNVDKVADFVAKVAGVLLIVCVLALLAIMARAMLAVLGSGTLLALLAMIAAGLAAGYLLAGDAPEDKTALSLAAATRHPGLAIAIATSNFPDAKLAPAAILLFAVLNAMVGIPYLRWLSSLGANSRGQ